MTHPTETETQSSRSHRGTDVGSIDRQNNETFSTCLALSQELSGCPIAFISQSDDQGVRFVAHSFPASFALAELPTDLSIGPKIRETIVPDMRLHPVLCHAAVVEYSPSFVFWAGFPLVAPDGARIGLLGLVDYHPHDLSPAMQRGLGQLASLIARQISATDESRERMSRNVIGLIDALHDQGSDKGLHILRGLIRFAANQTLRPVETTALRIAGLMEIKNGELCLTSEGRSLLSYHGFYSSIQKNMRAETEANAQEEVVPTPVLSTGSKTIDQPVPFARLRIGEVHYVIAEYPSGTLAFCDEVTGEWQALRNGLEEGWAEISAEIIQKSDCAFFDYVRMHMIRRRDMMLQEGEFVFDLHGLSWGIRQQANGTLLRLGDGEWQPISIAIAPGDVGLRNAAADVLLIHGADICAQITPDVHAWAKRIAAGASVMPLA